MGQNPIIIHTGLDGFALLKGIRSVSPEQILGWAVSSDAGEFEGIEILAQTGALHARYLCQFDQHVFLLKIKRFNRFQVGRGGAPFEIEGRLKVRTQSAFSYELTAMAEGTLLCSGEFSFAVVAYDQRFKKEILKPHYRSLFSCLSNSKTA